MRKPVKNFVLLRTFAIFICIKLTNFARLILDRANRTKKSVWDMLTTILYTTQQNNVIVLKQSDKNSSDTKQHLKGYFRFSSRLS